MNKNYKRTSILNTTACSTFCNQNSLSLMSHTPQTERGC